MTRADVPRGVYPPKGHGAFPPSGSPQFLIIMHLKYCADRYDMTYMSFDNQFETKVLFLMYFRSQIINEYYDDTNNGRMAD